MASLHPPSFQRNDFSTCNTRIAWAWLRGVIALQAMETFLDEEREGGLLAVPPRPTEYRRMLSWQLSQLQSAPVTNARRKEREKRRKRRQGRYRVVGAATT